MIKLTSSQLSKILTGYPQVRIDNTLLDNHLIFINDSTDKPDYQKYFAIIKNNSYPVVLELLSDYQLAKKLVNEYESIAPAKNIDPKNWIQIICSVQLSYQELLDLIRLSYDKSC